ncbi:hypothetical protein PFICI_11064 [Pestalotiopsis fici W106-1]|uniref:UBA domain-containing protein n=1 Tax=Pestalotiopsis fici (strain W106-1 / CGMCC3.15140) TaxID=1229662 RepID=W3WTM3_PESFW|nr:uncharacterized protein PFICI_11064 [Pestalotiopsis fici W106-1]ETS77190.1 hypothetical protein PFICI_11064 [Pestalotiopsis fici W106-1]
MDDLAGLDWSSTNPAKGAPKTTTPLGMNQNTFYPSLQPTPPPQVSGRNTPLSAQGSGLNALKATATKPAGDSFSNLVNFGGAKSNANLSLRERQEQLEAEKRRKAEAQMKQMQANYGSANWDNLGSAGPSQTASRTASPAVPIAGPGIGASAAKKAQNDDDDLFAAFNRNTKVDNASHYPPPVQPTSGKSTPASAARLDLSSASAWTVPPTSGGGDFGNDDDPFGLNDLKPKSSHQATPAPVQSADDDFLGDLGKPVEEVRRKAQAAQPKPEPGKPIEVSDSESEPELPQRSRTDDPFDKAVAELVDMGFTPENARRGLTESGGGLNVQAAVGWLLDDAHRTARREKQPSRDSPAERSRAREDGGRSRNNASPAWMREENPELPPRGDNRSPAAGGGDFSQKAAAMGTSFFKTANSLWKQGQKQVQKAVADFNQEGGDPNQPKWMRSAQQERSQPREKQSSSATDEAMMLDSGGRSERHASRSSREPSFPQDSRQDYPRDRSPAMPTRPAGQSAAAPKWQQAQPSMDPKTRLNKQLVEEQSAQAYVSPARRKRTTPQPQPQAPPEPEVDLFNTTAPVASAKPLPQRSNQPSPAATKPSSQPISRSITPRQPVPTRQIPSLAPATLQASTRQRLDGTAHFKRGDFDAAHTAYTNSLRGVPQTHPLCIVLLTNRSLTALKTGNPKQAVDDADAAISIIGPSRGEGEKVALGDGEQRDMKDLYGKALSRKAEALEQMEKWSDAGNVWQLCVEAGVGGASAIAGRQRCQKALAPKPKPTPRPVQAARPKPSASSSLAPQKDSEAVKRLRDANKAAEAADDEKFALSEKVDARIAAWRDGKRDNLRALIGSLDTVLWENSGWKKVGLHELVMANRVKIHYMKAIAKTHPDKLPQDASTEVKLIAATVFATLNESWDKFKAENGL